MSDGSPPGAPTAGSAAEYRQHRFRRPPGGTDLLLVRHGESEAAVDGRPFPLVDGQGDPALHPEGRQQAQRVADRLAGEPISAIYVTTLRRTRETAVPLAARLGLEPVVEPDLREVHLGDWEGGEYRRHVAEGHPIVERMRVEQRWDLIPGAEPAEDFDARVRGGVERLARRHPDETIAVFTHGGVIGAVLAAASGARPFAFVGADNGSVSHLVVTAERRWVVRRFNDVSHLTASFATVPEPLT